MNSQDDNISDHSPTVGPDYTGKYSKGNTTEFFRSYPPYLYTPPPPPKSRRGVISSLIGAVVLLIIILSVVSYFLWLSLSQKSQAPSNPTADQLSNQPETLTVYLVKGDKAATTRGSYMGPITITVAGVGQAAGKAYSDAFYIYTDDNAQHDIPPRHDQYLSLCINTHPLEMYGQSPPAYREDHIYTFTFNAPGGPLILGICDAQPSDNTGAFIVKISK